MKVLCSQNEGQANDSRKSIAAAAAVFQDFINSDPCQHGKADPLQEQENVLLGDKFGSRLFSE